MLLRQDRRRHQESDLLGILHGFERRPQGDLRLAVADVAADQAVHDAAGFHVRFDGFDRAQLVFRFLVGKEFLKFPLPDRIRAVAVTGSIETARVEPDQFFRDIINRFCHPGLRFLPFGAVQLVELRFSGLAVRVFLDQVQLGRGQVQVPAVGVLDLDIVLAAAFPDDVLQAAVYADAVALVDDVVAVLQFGERDQLLTVVFLFLLPPGHGLSEHVGFRDQDVFDPRIDESLPQASADDLRLSGLQRFFRAFVRAVRTDLVLPQVLRQTGSTGAGRRQHRDAVALPLVSQDIRDQHLEAVLIAADTGCIEMKVLYGAVVLQTLVETRDEERPPSFQLFHDEVCGKNIRHIRGMMPAGIFPYPLFQSSFGSFRKLLLDRFRP